MFEMYFTFLYVRLKDDTKSVGREEAEISHFFARRNDWPTGLAIGFQNAAFLYLVSKSAANVGDEAMAGLEVVRRKSLLGRRTDEELYFQFSMYYSYSAYKGCILRGGGYFDLNRDFMIGLFSTFLSYFIIIQQFHPYFDRNVSPTSPHHSIPHQLPT
jgi:hypothetical protein